MHVERESEEIGQNLRKFGSSKKEFPFQDVEALRLNLASDYFAKDNARIYSFNWINAGVPMQHWHTHELSQTFFFVFFFRLQIAESEFF